MPTSHGSLLFEDRGPVAEDSVHVARLRAAGAVPVGKTAAPEFGTLIFTKTKVFGITRNPWNIERTPGGSIGRHRRGRRRRHHPVRHRLRRRWLDPDPGGVHRSLRLQGELRSHPEPGSRRLAHRRRSARSRRPWPTARATSTSPPARTTPTGCRCRPPACATRTSIESLDVAGSAGPLVASTSASPPSTPRSPR